MPRAALWLALVLCACTNRTSIRPTDAETGTGPCSHALLPGEPAVVEGIQQTVGSGPGCTAFNLGRPYVVSSHAVLGVAYQAELLAALEQEGIGGSVVAEFFGEGEPIERIELEVGAYVPQVLAATVIRAARANTRGLPLVVYGNDIDEGFGDLQRVYVGSLLPSANAPADDALLDLLVDPRTPEKRFRSALPARQR